MSVEETIAWHKPSELLPDDDTTVLVIFGGDPDTYIGYLDASQWRDNDCVKFREPPLYWAHLPAGPKQ